MSHILLIQLVFYYGVVCPPARQMRLHRAVPSTKEDPAPSPSQRTTRIPDNDGNDGDEGGEDPDGTEKVVQAWGRYGNMMAELDIVFTAGLAKQLRTERDALLPMYQAKRTISFPKDDLG